MALKTRSKCLTALIFLGMVDTLIPVPILAIILIYVLFQRPPWFVGLVRDIYEGEG